MPECVCTQGGADHVSVVCLDMYLWVYCGEGVCIYVCELGGGLWERDRQVLRKVGVGQNGAYLDRCVYICVLERDASECVLLCVKPVLIDKYQRVPATPHTGGVCISECVLGVLPLASAGRFSWQRAPKEGCLEDPEASWMALPWF